MADALNVQEEDELFSEDWLDNSLTDTILDAKYEKVDVNSLTGKRVLRYVKTLINANWKPLPNLVEI